MPESIGDLLGRGIVSLIESANDAIETAPERRRVRQLTREVAELRAVNNRADADAARVEARQVFERVAVLRAGMMLPHLRSRLVDILRPVLCSGKVEAAAVVFRVGTEAHVYLLATGEVDRVSVSEPRLRMLLLGAESFVFAHSHRHGVGLSEEDEALAHRLAAFPAGLVDFLVITKSAASSMSLSCTWRNNR